MARGGRDAGWFDAEDHPGFVDGVASDGARAEPSWCIT
jgi:hypothetical protein